MQDRLYADARKFYIDRPIRYNIFLLPVPGCLLSQRRRVWVKGSRRGKFLTHTRNVYRPTPTYMIQRMVWRHAYTYDPYILHWAADRYAML